MNFGVDRPQQAPPKACLKLYGILTSLNLVLKNACLIVFIFVLSHVSK